MDKKVAAIEFGSKKLKLVVGYELNGQVYVIYSLTKPYSLSVENGVITDRNKIIQAVSEVRNFSDESLKLNINLSQALLALPSLGLEVTNGKQVSSVASEMGKISNLDIRNIYNLIRYNPTRSQTSSSDIIDIIPKSFYLEGGKIFTFPPIGEISRSLAIDAMVYSLPKKTIEEYSSALKSAGMNLKRPIIAPFGAASLISSSKDMPVDYFLVDIGSSSTTVSLVGQGDVYGSRMFFWGSDAITERIAESFNINISEAEKIKILYGIDKRQMNFKAPVCRYSLDDGTEIKHYADELNSIIKKELENFLEKLNSSLMDIITGYDKSILSLPMILVGGGAQLNGLVDYIEHKVQSEFVKVFKPTSLGARNATFTNCLGMILANSKYPVVFDESHPLTPQLTREPVKEK